MRARTDTFETAAEHEHELNAKQREILTFITRGHTNAEIAEALGMTFVAVKWNVSEILSKLGLATREDAAAYWQWRRRPAARLTRPLRALVGMGAWKWAASGATVAAVAAAVGAGALLWPGGRPASTRAIVPFYLEATVTVYDQSRDTLDLHPSDAGRKVVNQKALRWWYQDADHTRWEIDQLRPALRYGPSSTLVVDGTNTWLFDRDTNAYTKGDLSHWPAEDGLRPPAEVIMVGPARVRDLQGWVTRLSTWGNGRQPSAIIAQETLLGRRVAVIEYGRQDTYDRGNGTTGLTGLNRMWVDVRTLQILRHETDNGRFVAEVTRLDDESPIPAEMLRVALPAGATILQAPTPSLAGPPPRMPPPGTYPAGSLVPTYLPSAFEPRGASSAGNAPDDWQLTQHFGPPGGAVFGDGPLVIEERPRTDGFPRPVSGGTAAKVGRNDALLTVNGTTITLAWAQDGIAIILTAHDLPLDEVVAVAESLAPVDPRAPGASAPPPAAHPAGWLEPTYLPAGFVERGSRGDAGPGRWLRTAFFGPPSDTLSGEGPLTIEESARPDGLPSPLRAGTHTTVHGHEAFLTVDDTTTTLAWAQDGIAIVLTALKLPLDEVMAVAASLRPPE